MKRGWKSKMFAALSVALLGAAALAGACASGDGEAEPSSGDSGTPSTPTSPPGTAIPPDTEDARPVTQARFDAMTTDPERGASAFFAPSFAPRWMGVDSQGNRYVLTSGSTGELGDASFGGGTDLVSFTPGSLLSRWSVSLPAATELAACDDGSGTTYLVVGVKAVAVGGVVPRAATKRFAVMSVANTGAIGWSVPVDFVLRETSETHASALACAATSGGVTVLGTARDVDVQTGQLRTPRFTAPSDRVEAYAIQLDASGEVLLVRHGGDSAGDLGGVVAATGGASTTYELYATGSASLTGIGSVPGRVGVGPDAVVVFGHSGAQATSGGVRLPMMVPRALAVAESRGRMVVAGDHVLPALDAAPGVDAGTSAIVALAMPAAAAAEWSIALGGTDHVRGVAVNDATGAVALALAVPSKGNLVGDATVGTGAGDGQLVVVFDSSGALKKTFRVNGANVSLLGLAFFGTRLYVLGNAASAVTLDFPLANEGAPDGQSDAGRSGGFILDLPAL